MMAAMALASAPFTGSAMQIRVGPPYGGVQSLAGLAGGTLRAPAWHFVMHFCLLPANFARALLVPPSHLSSSLLGGANMAVADVARNAPVTVATRTRLIQRSFIAAPSLWVWVP